MECFIANAARYTTVVMYPMGSEMGKSRPQLEEGVQRRKRNEYESIGWRGGWIVSTENMTELLYSSSLSMVCRTSIWSLPSHCHNFLLLGQIPDTIQPNSATERASNHWPLKLRFCPLPITEAVPQTHFVSLPAKLTRKPAGLVMAREKRTIHIVMKGWSTTRPNWNGGIVRCRSRR